MNSSSPTRALPLETLSPEPLKKYHIVLALTSGRISGADIFSVKLVRELRARGFSAEIVMTGGDERVPDPLELSRDIPIQILPVSKKAGWQSRWQAMIRYLEDRVPCIYVPNYDWLHSCVSPKLSNRIKIVGIAHSDDPQHYEHVVRLGKYWNAIVAVSRVIADEILKRAPELAKRIYTIPYGVRVPPELSNENRIFAENDDARLRIVYAGRLIQHQKRVMDLPRIANILCARNVPFEMTVIGSGVDDARLREASGALIGQRRMIFWGSRPNDQVLRALQQHDVFILTSSFEGLPVSLLEAMAHGCVPVVSRVESGIAEIINDGVNGFVVPIGDIEQFADRLQQLQCDASLRTGMAENAQATIRGSNYELDTMVENYLALFARVIGDGYQRPPGKILPPPGLERRTFFSQLPSRFVRVAKRARRVWKQNLTG